MAIKPFEQVYPGQNAPDIKPKKPLPPREWERKQRMKEYRISLRREKRNRKSDEKKQRKLNATILRRMTRNPEKYTKNLSRNQQQAIEKERRKIQTSAVRLAQRLAAIYDPSGAMFDVAPVVTLEDGRVTTVEAMEKQKEREARKAAEQNEDSLSQLNGMQHASEPAAEHRHVNSDRASQFQFQTQQTSNLSRNQQKKQAAALMPQPVLPKPVIPEGIDIPSDEEEDWLALWELSNDELGRRLARAKKRAVRERKEFRQQQQSGKAERRAARDEKRKVYRSIKNSWQIIREEERRRRKFLVSMEAEERKRLAVQVNAKNRKDALEAAAVLGFTLENVQGVDDIQPRITAMKGMRVDFDKLEFDGDRPSGLKMSGDKPRVPPKGNRVDLGAIPDESQVQSIFAEDQASRPIADEADHEDFVRFGKEVNHGHDAQALRFNHKIRRKLRRAMEDAKISKEVLVRAKAIEHCEKKGLEVPEVLRLPARPITIKGRRTLPNGLLETDKQERTRAKVELSELNSQMRVLRKQAKEMAIEAGIRIYLELMGRIPKREDLDAQVAGRQAEKDSHNGPAAVHEMTSMADLIASWPMPEEGLGQLEGAFEDDFGNIEEETTGPDEDMDLSEDSTSKPRPSKRNVGGGGRGGEMASRTAASSKRKAAAGSESSVTESDQDDSDEDMSDTS